EEETLGLINLIIADGVINDDDVITIGNIKKQIIKKGGVLEFVITDENMNAVGGFDRLKSWIRKKKKIVDNLDSAKRFGVDVPKGIMLFGMPGCGKSLCAKALATEFGVPLLKLDMGMILGPYVGQSEENIRKAIKQSESIAPCVLWIDEIEKAFSGIGGSGGSAEVTTRIFGTLLTWMQERSRMVFVVATANDITSMPPEFLRRGRFDEVFFVDFPDIDERKEIIKIHLKKRKKEEWINKIDIDKMAKETEEFSGADLEAIVSSIVEEAFVNDWKEPVKEYVDNVVKEFKPLSHTMKDKIDQIKELYKKYNFINVSSRKK
ncbi:MAG: AAA family ATPase, partial [Thermodesulforhabdaceae bacterium]